MPDESIQVRSDSAQTKLAEFQISLEADLLSFCDGQANSRLHSLLMFSVGRVLTNWAKAHVGSPVVDIDNHVISHIADWLKVAIANDEKWLANVDKLGRPKKLMKFSNLAQITREADKAMFKAIQKGHSVEVVAEDEQLICKLNDGFYLVRLLSPKALDRESFVMQHCVGNGAYDHVLHSQNHDIYSLRDGNGKPHVTIEIDDGELIQIQGKQNRPPLKKYVDYIVPFLKTHTIEIDMAPARLGYVIDAEGVWHSIDNLPKGLTVKGHLNLCGSEITSLPSDLSIGGALFLMDTKITSLPDNLYVGGNLNIFSKDIRTLPKGLRIAGDFYLNETAIEELPEDIFVGGYLDLTESAIMRLPDGFTVSDSLNLGRTPISTLPINLSVGGDLSLERTNVTALPHGLSVKGDLYIQRLSLEAIAENVTIGGMIYHDGYGYSLEAFRNHLSLQQSKTRRLGSTAFE